MPSKNLINNPFKSSLDPTFFSNPHDESVGMFESPPDCRPQASAPRHHWTTFNDEEEDRTARRRPKSTQLSSSDRQQVDHSSQPARDPLFPPFGVMAVNDTAFTPKPFSGAEKDCDKVEQWLTYLETYFAFRSIQGISRVQLFHLLMADSAADWLRSLDESVRTDYDQLMEAFRSRYSFSDLDRWKKASSLWEKSQRDSESVDSFVTSILNTARMVPITDTNLIRFAVIRGLRPQIRLHVLQSSASDLDSVVRAARVAEAALAASTPPDDVKDLTAQVARLVAKFDAVPSTVAAVETTYPTGDPTSSRRVQFTESDQPRSSSRRLSPDRRLEDDDRRRRPRERSLSPSARWQNEGRSPQRYYTNTGFRPSSRPSGFDERRPSTRSDDREQQRNCGKCGRFHSSRDVCFAQNLTCFKCSRRDHLAKLCRSAPYYSNWQQNLQFRPSQSGNSFYSNQYSQPTQPPMYNSPTAPSEQHHS